MIFGLISALLTFGVVAFIGYGHKPATAGADSAAVYREQLANLDRDISSGTIQAAEGEALRVELSRRLIGATKSQGVETSKQAISPLLFALFIPMIVAPLYWHFGAPRVVDLPYQSRMANAVANNDYEAMVAQVEKHLADKPDDISGWKILAPAYAQIGRYNDAADAYEKIATLEKPTAEVLSSQGEMLTLANQGMITSAASAIFNKALEIDPAFPKARFFLAMSLKQEGKIDEAKSSYEKLLSDAPAGAPWKASVESELASLSTRPPGLTDQQVKDGTAMNAGDQGAMIHQMVDGLEQKLSANPDDLQGWLKLIRARTVLGETDKAKAARDKASAHYGENALVLKAIANLSAEIGLK